MAGRQSAEEERQSVEQKRLKHEAKQRRDYWMDLVNKFSVRGVGEDIDLKELMESYDITLERIKLLFQLIDLDNNNQISLEEFELGVRHLRLDFADDSAATAREVFAYLDTDKRGHITRERFNEAVRFIRLGMLFKQESQRRVNSIFTSASRLATTFLDCACDELTAIDWNSERAEAHDLTDLESSLDFHFGHRDSKCSMRWVVVNRCTPVIVLRLAVKYRFHPVATEDILKLRHQSAMVKSYSPHYFFVAPCFRLRYPPVGPVGAVKSAVLRERGRGSVGSRGHGMDVLEAWMTMFDQNAHKPFSDSKYELLSRNVVMCNVAMFVAGPPNIDTIITFQSKWQAVFQSLRSLTKKHHPSKPEGDEDKKKKDDPTSPVFKNIADVLLSPGGATMRTGTSDWMLYHLMDLVVDSMVPVISMYGLLLESLQEELHNNEVHTDAGDIKSLVIMRKDLLRLRSLIRPVLSIVRHVIEHPNFGTHTTWFFRDVEDNVKNLLEDVQTYSDWCHSLGEQYNAFRDNRMNNTLYVLTLLTAIFIPGQFLTGVFGMNFSRPDGSPNMPLLRYENGYVVFWCLLIGFTLLAIVAYRVVRFHNKANKSRRKQEQLEMSSRFASVGMWPPKRR